MEGCLGVSGAARNRWRVRALRAWLNAARISDGPIFRGVDRHGRLASECLTGRSIARIVKRAAGDAGLDADVFSGHSLRGTGDGRRCCGSQRTEHHAADWI